MLNEAIERVEKYLREKELGGKDIPAAIQLRDRLNDLYEGIEVPVVSFNCLDFAWQAGEIGQYPKSIILADTSLGNCVYYQPLLIDLARQLESLGKPKVSIIVPDSELFDPRPFNFSQDLEERQGICQKVLTGLSTRLSNLMQTASARIITWSSYCFEKGLTSPLKFTEEAYEKISSNAGLTKRVCEQAKSSRIHFIRRGISAEYVDNITEEEMFEKTKWYCAMYMGEALALSNAIVVNLEDLRVRAWYSRGVPNLPIITPVIPNEYYMWRNSTKAIL